MVTIDNYEEYLMMGADGELDAEGQIALDKFLRTHPNLAAEAEAWQTMRLQPDESQVYNATENLLKNEPKRIALGWKPIALAAAAALAAMLIAIPALMPDNNDKISGAVLVPKTSIPTTINPPAEDTTLPAVAAVPVPETQIPRIIEQKKNRRKPAITRTKLVAHSNIKSINPLTSKSIKASPLTESPSHLQVQAQPENVSVAIAPALQQEPEVAEHKLPRIRIAQANQPALDLLKRGVEERVAQASRAAKAIKETALVVKLGGNNLHINL